MDTDAINKKNWSHEGFVGEMIEHNFDELVTRAELYISSSSEKLQNLNALMMSVATKEGESFEGFSSEKEDLSALEFDLLSRIVPSEVKELQVFIADLQTETVRARELISSCKNFGESFLLMEEKLLCSEESLKQLQVQVSDIKTQSCSLRRSLACFHDKESSKLNTGKKIKMETAEQQRDILTILEKSLAREMSLEKKLTESRQVQEELKQKLHSYEHELCCMEEEESNVWEKLFEADYVAEVFLGTSKELLSRIHILQFNLNCSLEQEDELKSKFESADKDLKSQENTLKSFQSGETRLNDFFVAQTEILKSSLSEIEEKLILVNFEAFTLREKVTSLENQLKSSNAKNSTEEIPKEGNVNLHYQFTEFENVTEDLKEKLSKAENKVESAEARCKLLAETNMELNDEACLEKQSMLNCKVGDMENVIEDLKLKVSKAETRAYNAEERCVVLSESHADLNKEVNFLRGTKSATAKDIGVRSKGIANLVVVLAIQRERLHNQISLMAEENKVLVMKLQQRNESSSAYTSQDTEMGKNGEDMFVLETAMEAQGTCGVLKMKHVLVAILVLLISAAVCLFQQWKADSDV